MQPCTLACCAPVLLEQQLLPKFARSVFTIGFNEHCIFPMHIGKETRHHGFRLPPGPYLFGIHGMYGVTSLSLTSFSVLLIILPVDDRLFSRP